MNKSIGTSPFRKAAQRFRRNKPAVFGLGFIVFAIAIAILGYLITPDNSPNADFQVLDLNKKDIGYSTKVLRVHRNQKVETVNFLSRMLFGQKSKYDLYPIKDYFFSGDSIIVSLYKGEKQPDERNAFHQADVVFPVKRLSSTNSEIQITTVFEQKETTTLKKLQEQIERQHIYQKTFWLGSDKYGRDILSRLIIGLRISLGVGLMAVLISLVIGIFFGAIAGYFGRRIDDAILFLINVFWSIPTLLMVFAIVLVWGRGISTIFVAVGLTMWVEVARIVRGQVLSVKQELYVEAARSLGYSTTRTIVRHILPNILGPVMVVAAANFAAAILIEAGLSFLGFGINPPQPSWGTMLSENKEYLITNKAFLAILPGFAIVLMVLSFNMVGNGLRDALDVKSVR